MKIEKLLCLTILLSASCEVYADSQLAPTNQQSRFRSILAKSAALSKTALQGTANALQDVSKKLDSVVTTSDTETTSATTEIPADTAVVMPNKENTENDSAVKSASAPVVSAQASPEKQIVTPVKQEDVVASSMPQSNAETIEDIRTKAEKGDALSQAILGQCYRLGELGLSVDKEKARKWIDASAAKNNPLGLGNKAKMDADDTYFKKAVDAGLIDLAKSGNVRAQNMIGMCYAAGLGVVKNPLESVNWYRKAAEQGYALAQVNVGLCYQNGAGIETNASEAVKWYRKAAEQGYGLGQVKLGLCHIAGTGIEKDPVVGVGYIRKAAEQKFAMGQRLLGVCYSAGIGVEQSTHEAFKWYEKAAEQGDAVAQVSLGELSDNPRGSYAPDSAFKWYKRAAEQGDAVGQCRLGVCYTKGMGVQANPYEAVNWYRKAAEQGNTEGQVNLGLCFESGAGVKEDPVEAEKWYRKAATSSGQDLAIVSKYYDMPKPTYLAEDVDIKNLLPIKDVVVMGVYLGMAENAVDSKVQKEDVRTALSKYVGKRNLPVTVVKASNAYYLVAPTKKVYGSVFLNKYGNVSRIAGNPQDFGAEVSELGYDHDGVRARVIDQLRLKLDANGFCQYKGLKVEFDESYVTFKQMPVTSPESLSRIAEMQSYFSKQFAVVDKNIFGVKLGESIQSVVDKLDEKKKKYEVSEYTIGGSEGSDDVGIPDKQISYRGAIADIDIVGQTQLHFIQDVLVKVYCYQLKVDLSEQLREAYPGANIRAIETSVDGHPISISYPDDGSGRREITYDYRGAQEAGERLRDRIVAAIQQRNKAQTNKQLKKIDL